MNKQNVQIHNIHATNKILKTAIQNLKIVALLHKGKENKITSHSSEFFMGNSFHVWIQCFTRAEPWKVEDVIFSTAMEVLTALF